MNINGKSVLDRIRQRNMLPATTPVAVKGIVAKDISIQQSSTDRFINVIATTNDIDSDGDVIVPEGADTSYFFAKGQRKIFVDHNLGTENCVGVLHSASLKPNGWLCRIRMFSLPGNPLPDDILTIAREAGIGVSIGFIPTDMGPPNPEETTKYGKSGAAVNSVIRKWKWIELSITAAPANVNCQSMMSENLNEGKRSVISELVSKGKISSSSVKALGLGQTSSLVVPKKKRITVVVG